MKKQEKKPISGATPADSDTGEKCPTPIIGAIILNNKDEIFLSKGKKWGGKYSIPGGHIDLNEALEAALHREIMEEVGIETKIIAPLGFGESINSDEYHASKHLVFVTYLCRYEGDPAKIKMNEEFEKEFVWVSPEQAKKMDLSHGVRKSVADYENYVKAANALDSWKRCQADFENYKKDQARAREEFRKYAKMDVVEQLLPVLDNFEASFEHVPLESKKDKWVEGIVYIKKQMEDVLKHNGVEEIMVKEGDKFDPEIHEAVSGNGEKQVVKKILQKGYKLNERLIRAAKVEVA